MPRWLSDVLEQSNYFMPHGHCYLWLPALLWLHVISDALIGIAYLGISIILYVLVRKIRLPFSPVFIAFGLFIALCGLTHFMKIWTVWHPDYVLDGMVKAATAAASVATAIGLFFVRPQVEEVVSTARLSEQRRVRLESTHAELQALYGKVKELDALKSQFFANVSHELRTPLALILGPAEHLLGDPALTQDQRRQIESISRNGKSLLKQVNDLLDMAKLEAGKMEVRYVRLDLVPWLRRIAAQFEMAAEQRHIDYRIATPDQLLAEVDADMVERIFVNLLSNAFKFTPDQGRIRITLESGADELVFCVSDTGPGVPADQQAAIFERFHQADGALTRRHGGTGLGLAMAKDYAQLHGGSIALVSAPGGGAEFTVHLPLSAPASAVVGAPSPLPDTAGRAMLDATLQELTAGAAHMTASQALPTLPGRASVLVVEDNPEMRSFVAITLQGQYNVTTACDGQEGLESALVLQPDLIVTDLMMPRMSGDQLLAAVRSRPQFDAVPVILLTAKTDDALRVQLLQNGAQDFLTKPFLPQELQARTRNLVAMKRTGDALRSELASASDDVEGMATELAIKHRQLQTALDVADVARTQAERASQVKSQFLAMISHELRTPLSTIHMNAQLLEHYQDGQLQDSLKPSISRLARASQQMSTLIEGLLEYTRVESGNIHPRWESVELAGLAQDVIDSHANHTAPGVQLQLDLPPPDLAPMVTDARLLSVILSNLISNALKFTKLGTVTIRLSNTGSVHTIEVQDSGIGIPQADIGRIFLPFEQLEPVRRKSIPGVGLGLALVKQIVDALGGRIAVRSEDGVGSTFTVQLPSQPPAGNISDIKQEARP